MQLQENTLFDNRYTLKKFIGRGGFAEVWLVEDTLTGLEEALKIYAPGTGLDEDGAKMFIKELSVVHDLRHTNILTPKSMGQYERQPYLVLPYCPHGSLSKKIGQLSEEEVWKVLHQVSAGLAYLHAKGIVHQDIKPDNILIDANRDYVITDFGISMKAQSTLRKSMRVQANSGTTAYMAPERFSNDPQPKPEQDIWSLGAMLYELVEGDVPFNTVIGSLAQQNGAPIPNMKAAVSDELKQTILKYLSLNPMDRPTAASPDGVKVDHSAHQTKFCASCGSPLSDNVKFCPTCGHSIGQPVVKHVQDPKAIFDIEKLEFINHGKKSFTLNFNVNFLQSEHAYIFLSFYYDNAPVVNFEDKSMTYGDMLLVRKNNHGKGTKSTTFDFSNTNLVKLSDDELLTIDMLAILSLHNDNNEYAEDIHINYKIDVMHISHMFKHDEWEITKIKRVNTNYKN